MKIYRHVSRNPFINRGLLLEKGGFLLSVAIFPVKFGPLNLLKGGRVMKEKGGEGYDS